MRNCDTQVCSSCRTSVLIPSTKLYRHIRQCRPRCSRCYFTHLSLRRRPLFRPNGRWCSCEARDRKWYRQEKRLVCRDCTMEPAHQLRLMRERRAGQAIKRMMEEVKCSECGTEFKRGGVQWWICAECEGECIDECHEWWWRLKG